MTAHFQFLIKGYNQVGGTELIAPLSLSIPH